MSTKTSSKVPFQLPVVLTKELVNGKTVYVAETPAFGIASQGYTQEEAIENLKEAVELYCEDEDAKAIDMSSISLSFVPMTISKKVISDETSSAVRA